MGNTNILQKLMYYFSHFLLVISFIVKLSSSSSIPANFIFGDSLVDVGNNNYIASLSKADFAPNGIDFGNPTGRFTNGRTIVDILGKFSTSSKSSFYCNLFNA